MTTRIMTTTSTEVHRVGILGGARSVVPGAPSGEQFELIHGEQRATVVEVGGGIRAYTVGGREVLESYPVDAMCDGGHGAVLIPWPNRLADGAYTFDGVARQLPVDEVDKNNANHGLLRWRAWQCLDRRDDEVVLGIRLHPMPGYPFTLDVQVSYALGQDGLVVTTAATNVGATACPYACGHHPYLSPGPGLVDAAALTLDAATWIDTENPRRLPTGCAPVAGGPLDFRSGAPIAQAHIDVPFTDLARAPDGRATARLTGPDEGTVELWVDPGYPIIQIFTGDTLRPDRARRGLACEPMTAPPNALATGTGVIRLEPDQSVTTRWGARLT
jgi:aldose 1-epimerase